MPTRSSTAPVTPKGRRTREGLLEAGERVAERAGLSGLNVAAVVAEADVAKGTFYVYFSGRDDFVDALHQRFYARVGAAVEAAVQGLEPGHELLAAAIDAYLDVCLANRAVKALVLETRAQGELTTTIAEREDLFVTLARPSLEAMGLKPATAAARLFVALTAEAALIEMEAGHRVPGARRLIQSLAGTRQP